MIRSFIFFAGEFRITLPIVFSNENWQHSMMAKTLELNPNGTFKRTKFSENLLGCIYYANVENETLRRQNFNFLIENNIPCWPNPKLLLEYDDRHLCLKKCIDAGLVKHSVLQTTYNKDIDFPTPFVLKTGNSHQGQNKFLINYIKELQPFEGIATIEPFFEGISCRVLWVGDVFYKLRFDNNENWIKNAVGAELDFYPTMPNAVIEHSKKVKDLFGLEICGIDYIVDEKKDDFHFLEYNYFPGLGLPIEESDKYIDDFFKMKMLSIEEASRTKSLDELLEITKELENENY
jgi:hypothetical protein